MSCFCLPHIQIQKSTHSNVKVLMGMLGLRIRKMCEKDVLLTIFQLTLCFVECLTQN